MTIRNPGGGGGCRKCADFGYNPRLFLEWHALEAEAEGFRFFFSGELPVQGGKSRILLLSPRCQLFQLFGQTSVRRYNAFCFCGVLVHKLHYDAGFRHI